MGSEGIVFCAWKAVTEALGVLAALLRTRLVHFARQENGSGTITELEAFSQQLMTWRKKVAPLNQPLLSVVFESHSYLYMFKKITDIAGLTQHPLTDASIAHPREILLWLLWSRAWFFSGRGVLRAARRRAPASSLFTPPLPPRDVSSTRRGWIRACASSPCLPEWGAAPVSSTPPRCWAHLHLPWRHNLSNSRDRLRHKS